MSVCICLLYNFVVFLKTIRTQIEFMYAEVEFESIEDAHAWDPVSSGLGSYLDGDVTEKPGQSMSAYWMVTRELIHGLD